MSTVSNGVIASLSVSQISKFNEAEYGGCPRRWWLTKLGGEVEPVTKAVTAGVAGHAQDEHYLKTGEDVLGRHAMAGKHLMPLPGPDLFVEWGLNNQPKPKGKHYFPAEQSLLFAAKVPLIGFIDLLHVRGTYMDESGGLVRDPPNTGEVWDHKYTSKLEYAKSGPALLETTQMVGYGEFLTKKFPGLNFIRLTHLYRTYDGKPGAVKSTILVPTQQIHDRWGVVEEKIVPAMKEVAKATRLEDVPKCRNAGERDSACFSFGRNGCPFRSRCFPNIITRLSMGLLSKNRSAASNGAVAVAVSSIPPGIPPPPGAKRLVIEDKSTPPPAEAISAWGAVQGSFYTLGDGTVAVFTCQTSGKMSFLPLTGGAPILLSPDTLITQKAPPSDVVEQPPLPPPPAAAPPAVRVDEQLAAEPEAPKKRGRPRKIVEPTPTPSPLTPSPPGLRIYYACVPNGQYTPLDQYVNSTVAEICEEHKVFDIRCATDKDSPLAYGGWRGVLAAMVRAEPPADGSYVAFKGSELTDVVVEALSGICAPGALVRGQ